MIDHRRTAALLLAGGRSERFGRSSKLLAALNDRPLVDYAARTIDAEQFGARLAVIPPGNDTLAQCLEARQFTIIVSPQLSAGMGDNLALGINERVKGSFDHCVVLLADMPFVTSETLTAVMSASPDADAVVVTDGNRSSPPARFHKSLFTALTALSGDRGAKDVLASAKNPLRVVRPSRELFDIDTVENLQAAERVISQN